MFIGYEIKSNQGQAKPIVPETDIKLSQAVLDPKSYKKEPVTLVVEHNKKQFILAVLDPTQSWQCPLDLMFAAGSELKLFIRGSGTVHVTGFELRDDLDEDFDMSMSSDEEEEEDEDVGDAIVPHKSSAKTPPKVNGVKMNGKKESARKESAKKESAKKDSAKKPTLKGARPSKDQEDDDDHDSSDDEDFDIDDSDLDEMDDSDEEMDDSDLGELDIESSDEDDDGEEVEDEESD